MILVVLCCYVLSWYLNSLYSGHLESGEVVTFQGFTLNIIVDIIFLWEVFLTQESIRFHLVGGEASRLKGVWLGKRVWPG